MKVTLHDRRYLHLSTASVKEPTRNQELWLDVTVPPIGHQPRVYDFECGIRIVQDAMQVNMYLPDGSTTIYFPTGSMCAIYPAISRVTLADLTQVEEHKVMTLRGGAVMHEVILAGGGCLRGWHADGGQLSRVECSDIRGEYDHGELIVTSSVGMPKADRSRHFGSFDLPDLGSVVSHEITRVAGMTSHYIRCRGSRDLAVAYSDKGELIERRLAYR